MSWSLRDSRDSTEGIETMRQTGIIMEIKGERAIVLTRDGQFLAIQAQPQMLVGAEVTDLVPSSRRDQSQWPMKRLLHTRFLYGKRGRASAYRRAGVLSGIAATLLVGVFGWHLYQVRALDHTPYAYVALETDHSVGLVLNDKMRVIGTTSFHGQGQAEFRPNDVVGKTMQQAVQTIVTDELKHNSVSAQNPVYVAVAPAHQGVDTNRVRSAATQIVEQAINAHWSVLLKHPEIRSETILPNVWQDAVKKHSAPSVAGRETDLERVLKEIAPVIGTQGSRPSTHVYKRVPEEKPNNSAHARAAETAALRPGHVLQNLWRHMQTNKDPHATFGRTGTSGRAGASDRVHISGPSGTKSGKGEQGRRTGLPQSWQKTGKAKERTSLKLPDSLSRLLSGGTEHSPTKGRDGLNHRGQ